jgi:hypothetical protein
MKYKIGAVDIYYLSHNVIAAIVTNALKEQAVLS